MQLKGHFYQIYKILQYWIETCSELEKQLQNYKKSDSHYTIQKIQTSLKAAIQFASMSIVYGLGDMINNSQKFLLKIFQAENRQEILFEFALTFEKNGCIVTDPLFSDFKFQLLSLFDRVNQVVHSSTEIADFLKDLVSLNSNIYTGRGLRYLPNYLKNPLDEISTMYSQKKLRDKLE